MTKSIQPVALIVLDGWGFREMEHGNAIALAKTPKYCQWLKGRELSLLDASGGAVGLSDGQMGNSEVGHLNLGAGFVVYQDITRIDNAIENGSFYQNPLLVKRLDQVKQSNTRLHLIGLLGPGGVHSHDRHLYALIKMAKDAGIRPVLHMITDGRDTPPRSAQEFARNLEAFLDDNRWGTVGSVSGRYYAMDRDKRWDRTKKAYDAIALRRGLKAASASQAIANSYAKDVGDEFIEPTVIEGESHLEVQSGDSIIFYNFRADRMRQIVKSFALGDFHEFPREQVPTGLNVVTFTEYAADLPVAVLFPSNPVTNPLARILSERGLAQFHAAETEKYAHVTYFFNGGREEPFDGEERLLVPSPKVATYDLKPEMSAYELTDQVVQRIRTRQDSFVLVNFANPDMVGHSGILEAAIRAVQVVDECVGRIVAEIAAKGGIALITADHGNAERMIDESNGQPHTYHTLSPVPFFALKESYVSLRPRGVLADVAPTILELLGLPKPEQMSGKSLLNHS